MLQEHLNRLKEMPYIKDGYPAKNSLKWAEYVLPNNQLIDKSGLDTCFSRCELIEYCKNHNNSHLNTTIAILSWGGMRRDHAKRLFENYDHLEPLIIKLRSNAFTSRKQAFEEFQKRRRNELLSGLGIGYFTKLICFLAPKINGYIMDQWVGKSINLLTGSSLVKITNKVWVNDQNDSDVYEVFCKNIDLLGEILGCNGLEAEERIFSFGGRNKGEWRKYLISRTT